jgi:hypothetical protein
MPTISPEEERLFWSLVRKYEDPRKCWEWLGNLHSDDRGRICLRSQHYIAPRMSFHLTYGGDPEWLFVCHTCDNPICVNPDHFFLGTHGDNNRDSIAKGRRCGVYEKWRNDNPQAAHAAAQRVVQWRQQHPESNRGENANGVKLTTEYVLAIRARATKGETHTSLAREYGVAPQTVDGIVSRKHWKHI